MRPIHVFKHDITFWVSLPLIFVAIIYMIVLKESVATAIFWAEIIYALMALTLILIFLEVIKIIDVPRLWIGGSQDHEVDPSPRFFFILDDIENFHSRGDQE